MAYAHQRHLVLLYQKADSHFNI